MSTVQKTRLLAALSAFVVVMLAAAALFGIHRATQIDPVERRAVSAFGQDVEQTLLPMVSRRDALLTADDARRIATLEQTYVKLQDTANRHFWTEGVMPPDAPFFKKLTAYDGEQMSAYKRTVLLSSVQYDIQSYGDKIDAVVDPSPNQNGDLVALIFSCITLSAIAWMSYSIGMDVFDKRYAKRRENA